MGHRLFHHASRLGYFLAITLTLLAFVMMVEYSLSHPPHSGLRVQIARADAAATGGIDPILVTVRAAGRGRPPVLFLNALEVPREQLEVVVNRERAKRPPEWPVYLAAEGDLNWEPVAGVIDRLKGLGVQVSLVTARTQRSDARNPRFRQ